jgi:hypothetical protein
LPYMRSVGRKKLPLGNRSMQRWKQQKLETIRATALWQ